LLQDGARQVLVVGHGAQQVGEADAQVGLLQHVEQARHRPAPGDLALERNEAHRLRLTLQRRHRDPATAAPEDVGISVVNRNHPRMGSQSSVGRAHADCTLIGYVRVSGITRPPT